MPCTHGGTSFDFLDNRKLRGAFSMLKQEPHLWFGSNGLSARDRQLLAAAPVPFVKYGTNSTLRKIVRCLLQLAKRN